MKMFFQKLLVALLFVFFYATSALAQNVGIGTTTPTEKLDVNGNMNLSGNLKTNNNAGVSGQVLGTNSSGSTVWVNLQEYNSHLTYVTPGSDSWIVPANITKIFVEAWGGGGGGSPSAGGGGGGYIGAYFTVTPGATVTFVVGSSGAGALSGIQPANHGSRSSILMTGLSLYANGGLGSYGYAAGAVRMGRGGTFDVSNGNFKNWFGIKGQDGSPNVVTYSQLNATTFYETTVCGNGGDAGNSSNTGATGGYNVYNLTYAFNVKYIVGGLAGQPGGGGCGNRDNVSYAGYSGENGMVRIHY